MRSRTLQLPQQTLRTWQTWRTYRRRQILRLRNPLSRPVAVLVPARVPQEAGGEQEQERAGPNREWGPWLENPLGASKWEPGQSQQSQQGRLWGGGRSGGPASSPRDPVRPSRDPRLRAGGPRRTEARDPRRPQPCRGGCESRADRRWQRIWRRRRQRTRRVCCGGSCSGDSFLQNL